MIVLATVLLAAVSCAAPKDVLPLFGTETRLTTGMWECVRRPTLLETFTREHFVRRSVKSGTK